MNDTRLTDRLLATWFESEAPASAPDALRTDIYRATAAIRPRPAWLARLRGNPMDVITGGARRRDARLVPLLALLGLLIALVTAVAAVYVGSRRPENPLAVLPSTSPSATPAASLTPALTRYADLALSMPYPIRQVQLGLGANYVGIAGPDTNELLRSVYRVDTARNGKSLVVDNIPVGPSDHASFAASGNVIVIGHDEGNRALRFDARSGAFLGETRIGTRPLEPSVGAGSIWFPTFGDGSITGVDPQTGAVVATIPIPEFNGVGPLSIATSEGNDRLWAISPSSQTLAGIVLNSRSVDVKADLPAGTYCGVGVTLGRVWVTGCEGSPTVLALYDAYTAQRSPEPVDVGRGVLATVFEHNDRAWFVTEDQTNPDWTTKLVPVETTTLAVGKPVDVGARVRVVPTGNGVWLIRGMDLYRLRLDALPSD
jgi:hypothetical protein